MKRQISGPASALLKQANVSPEQVDAAFDELVRAKGSTILRMHHPLVQDIGQAADINLVQISRRSRTLLIEIEERRDDGPYWQYREHRPRHCTFSCRGQIPDAIGTALSGELLEKLVRPALSMEGSRIIQIDKTSDGWLNVDITPSWHIF